VNNEAEKKQPKGVAKAVDRYTATTIPVRVDVDVKQAVLNLEEAEKILREANSIALGPCDCRRTTQKCDAPIDSCLTLNQGERRGGQDVGGIPSRLRGRGAGCPPNLARGRARPPRLPRAGRGANRLLFLLLLVSQRAQAVRLLRRDHRDVARRRAVRRSLHWLRHVRRALSVRCLELGAGRRGALTRPREVLRLWGLYQQLPGRRDFVRPAGCDTLRGLGDWSQAICTSHLRNSV